MDDAPGVEEQKELPPPPGKPPFTFMSLDVFYAWLGLQSGVAWIDSAEAERTHVGTWGSTFYFSLGIGLFDLVTLGGSFGAIFPDDNAGFEEEVVPVFEDEPPTTKHSSLSVTNHSFELGLRTPNFCLSERSPADYCFALHAFTNFGRYWTAGGRHIEHCVDCTTQDVELKDGVFLEPGIAVGLPSRDWVGMDLRTSFRQSLGDGAVASELRLGFALMFF